MLLKIWRSSLCSYNEWSYFLFKNIKGYNYTGSWVQHYKGMVFWDGVLGIWLDVQIWYKSWLDIHCSWCKKKSTRQIITFMRWNWLTCSIHIYEPVMGSCWKGDVALMCDTFLISIFAYWNSTIKFITNIEIAWYTSHQ